MTTDALRQRSLLFDLFSCDSSLGGENLAVAQNTYSVNWFKGKELNMVFGLQLSFSRVVSLIILSKELTSSMVTHFSSLLRLVCLLCQPHIILLFLPGKEGRGM